jgi:hypothetical protein
LSLIYQAAPGTPSLAVLALALTVAVILLRRSRTCQETTPPGGRGHIIIPDGLRLLARRATRSH